MQYSYEIAMKRANDLIMNAPANSKVYVGADSVRTKKRGKWRARYCGIVIIHIAGNKGGQVAYWVEEHDDYSTTKNPKQRLLHEANVAIQGVDGVIDACLEKDFPLEVHLDLNPDPGRNGKNKSNAAVKEACGWVLSSTGIDPFIKPKAWAASRAADEAVKGRMYH